MHLYQLNQLEKIEELKALKGEYWLFYTMHLDESLNVRDFNSLVAKAYMETVERTIQVAKKLQIIFRERLCLQRKVVCIG